MWHVISGSCIVYSTLSKEKAQAHYALLDQQGKGEQGKVLALKATSDLTADALEFADKVLTPWHAVISDDELSAFGETYPKHPNWVDGDKVLTAH